LKNALSTRLAHLRKRTNNSRTYRLLGARGAAALLLGAALSVGGLTDALEGAHFVVEKDLDSVQVVKQQGQEATVVADVHDGFAANSLFKLSRVLPGSLVSQRIALFDDGWLPKPDALTSLQAPHAKRDVFHEEMARINSVIRRQFFSNAMPYGEIIHEKSVKYDVDPALVAAVIEQESKFHRTAHSPVGARGLMQLMPRTGRWLGARNLYDPEQNVDAGVKYIKYLQQRFDGNVKKTIAAYNAGEGNVKRYNGIPPFRETQTYVKRVMSNYQKRNEQLRDFSAEHAGVADDGVRTLR
jgi:soluble lytic murein transglycosylase-like protein